MERRGKYRVKYFALRDNDEQFTKIFREWFIKKREEDIKKNGLRVYERNII